MVHTSTDHVAYYRGNKYSSFQDLHKTSNMRGAKRVIIFCLMVTVFPTVLIIIPLYLRHVVYADVVYTVTESDVLEINKGISSIFCSEQSLQMNTSFNAFRVKQIKSINTKRKHIRLKKSMSLPDDTLEYWGFYLLKGATVLLKVCSRYEGSRILVVRGERNLRTCGLMEHNSNKFGAAMDEEYKQVKVTFESAHEIEDINNTRIADYVVNPNPLLVPNAAIEDVGEEDKLEEDLSNTTKQSTGNKKNLYHIRHHTHKKIFEKQRELYKLQQELQSNEQIKFEVNRMKRDTTGHLFDTRIEHGGNAINYSNTDSNENSNSVSSFENSLLTCYNGQILLSESFPPSHLCTDVHYLEQSDRMETVHDIVSDGYYYYIFYSDNDFTRNDIHAIFDIHKPTLKFANISKSKSCINETICKFPIYFLSDESVIVEVPVRDGIEHGSDDDDISLLISKCHPRMAVYIIFPIALIIVILSCAFI